MQEKLLNTQQFHEKNRMKIVFIYCVIYLVVFSGF